MWIVIEETPPDQMYFEQIGGVRIFRPRASHEIEVRTQAEQNLRSAYEVGKYTDRDGINQILHHQYAFFTNLLEQVLPQIASLDFLIFVLAEYEGTAKIDRLYKSGDLDSNDKMRWAELGPVVRRAIKYLAEQIILLVPKSSLDMPTESALEILEQAWICAEELVRYYLLSDQTFMIFPESTVLEIHPEGALHYWTLELNAVQAASETQERTLLDTEHRDRFVPTPSFDLDVREHEELLKTAFEETIGISYLRALGILHTLIDGAELPEEGFPIPFVHRDQTLDLLSSHLGFPRRSVEQVLAGFSISRSQLEAEEREVWKPKQEYRAFRRGIFEVEHSTGTHWVFSKALARECVIQLVGGVVFKDLPHEWRSGRINAALDALSNKAGRWFEKVVLECLESVGISGVSSQKNGVGRGEDRVLIPAGVGEIDYLGYSLKEKLLVVVECKMVRGGFEPKYFRDEVSEFITSSDSYFAKFQRKVDWVRSNVDIICQALGSVRDNDIIAKPTHLATAVVTFYPTIASFFAEQFPCVTLTEVMTGYEEKNRWPYVKGIHSC